jgi:hypothetical protein
VRKPEEKRPLGRPRRTLVSDNINMYLGEIEWDVVDRIDLTQDRDRLRAFVNTASSGSRKFLGGSTSGSLSRRTQLHGVSSGWRVLLETPTP